MAKITKTEILRLAKLSNLTIKENEIQKLQGELENILAHIDEISNLNNLESNKFNLTGLTNVYSEDVVNSFDVLDVNKINKNAETYNNYFVVDALIDKSKK